MSIAFARSPLPAPAAKEALPIWPDVAAPIHGAPRDLVTVPSDAPPLFLAVANDYERAAQTKAPFLWSPGGCAALPQPAAGCRSLPRRPRVHPQ